MPCWFSEALRAIHVPRSHRAMQQVPFVVFHYETISLFHDAAARRHDGVIVGDSNNTMLERAIFQST